MLANRAAQGTMAAHALRMKDSDHDEYSRYDDETGDYADHVDPPLGEPGEIHTSNHIRHIDWPESMHLGVPDAVKFGSPQSAWRKHGHYEEVPVPEISTLQREVSSRRVKQIMDNPSMGSSPRLPYPERAHGYRYDDDTVVVTDGNHRTMSHVLGGQMFVPMQVAEANDVSLFADQAKRLGQKRRFARENPNANPNWEEEHEQRQNDALYGTGNW